MRALTQVQNKSMYICESSINTSSCHCVALLSLSWTNSVYAIILKGTQYNYNPYLTVHYKLTCSAGYTGVFKMSAIVCSNAVSWAADQKCFQTSTVHIVKPN